MVQQGTKKKMHDILSLPYFTALDEPQPPALVGGPGRQELGPESEHEL